MEGQPKKAAGWIKFAFTSKNCSSEANTDERDRQIHSLQVNTSFWVLTL